MSDRHFRQGRNSSFNALGSKLAAVGLERARITDLENIFIGPRRSTVEESQVLIVGFYIPVSTMGKFLRFGG
jgi:hypothetical protein